MTVPSTIARVSYAGNGATTGFTVPFYFLANDQLSVVKRSAAGVDTTLVLNSDYSVAGAGNQAGGMVTTTVAPATGETLTILRNVPETQLTDYQPNDPFPEESHERALDKLTMIVQQQRELLLRALLVRDGETGPVFPSPDADKLIGWTSSGTALENKTVTGLSPGSIVVFGDPTVVTGANHPVSAAETFIVINRSNPLATALTLPPLATRNGLPLAIVDLSTGLTGEHTITITPDGAERIMRAATASLVSSNGFLTFTRLYPVPSISNWVFA
jgi:hypothetical protein